jgi:hypothetical protein
MKTEEQIRHDVQHAAWGAPGVDNVVDHWVVISGLRRGPGHR